MGGRIPVDALFSVEVTIASFTITAFPVTLIVWSWPFTVPATVTTSAITLPGTSKGRSAVRCSLYSAFSSGTGHSSDLMRINENPKPAVQISRAVGLWWPHEDGLDEYQTAALDPARQHLQESAL
jgi:hypothetical protein